MGGERFHVRLVEDGGSSNRVVVEVSMDGFNILSSDGSRVLRKYPLHQIARWSLRGNSLLLFTRSPVDIEDVTVTLQGDENTIRSVLDTLTSCCMQMTELLQSGHGSGDRAAANQLASLLKKSRKQASLPTADQVEFWKSPEKAGWMYSQGEHIKTWRKRWFVLKQGFLFRFSSQEVGPASKPRGIVDLSQVTDVAEGTSTTGRPMSIKLSTATGGSKCYLTESETAQVEWISALEGAVAKILKIVAGLDDEDGGVGGGSASASVARRSDGGGGGGGARSLEDQLRRSYGAASGSGGGGGGVESSNSFAAAGRRPQPSSNTPQTINIINYSGNGGNTGGPRGDAYPGDYSSGGGAGHYLNIDYGSGAGGGVAGAQEAPLESPSSYAPPSGGGTGSGLYGSVYQPQQAQPQYQPPHQQQHQQPHQQQHLHYPQQQPMSMPASGGYDTVYGTAPMYGNIDAVQQQPYQQQQQYHHPQQGAQAPVPSLLDSVTSMPPSGPPPAPSSPWQTHYTQDGRPYYFDTTTGITTWTPPEGMNV